MNNGNGTQTLKETIEMSGHEHKSTNHSGPNPTKDAQTRTPPHRKESEFTGIGQRMSPEARTTSELARHVSVSSTMSSTNPNLSPPPKESAIQRSKSRKAPRPFAVQSNGVTSKNVRFHSESSGNAAKTRKKSKPKSKTKRKKSGNIARKQGSLKLGQQSLELEVELDERRDSEVTSLSEFQSAASLTSVGTFHSTYSSNKNMKNPRAWKKKKQKRELAEKHRSRTPAGFGMTLRSEKQKQKPKKKGTNGSLEVVRKSARLIVTQLQQASSLLSSRGTSSRRIGEIPLRDKHKIIVGSTPIGLGGFSTVYPGTKWRMLRGSEDSYELAVKVCELDPDAVKVPEDEDGEMLGGATLGQAFAPEQSVADLDELKNEVLILDLLNTPTGRRHVARLLDCYELERKKRVCLIMERYTLDLDDPARAKIFEDFPVAKLVVIRQVVEALKYMKERRIIHGDLKPSNLLISKLGIVRLCDFGLAKRVDKSIGCVEVDKVKGSPEFMAPELLEEGQQYDYSVDVWSLGIIIYALWNKGETMFDQYQTLSMRCFSEDYWIKYRLGDPEYFNSLLGTRYLTPKEHKEMQRPGAKPNKLLERAYKRSRTYVEPIAELVRGAVMPHPEHARAHKVVRDKLHDRIELKVIEEETRRLLKEEGYPSPGRQNSLMIQVVKKFMELEG